MFERRNTHLMSFDEDINITKIKFDKEETKIGSFDYAIAINRWCMRMLGFWPLKNKLFSNLQYGLIIIFIVFLVLSTIIELLMGKEWNAIVHQITLALPCIPLIAKFVFIKVMNKNFRYILRTMIADWMDYRYMSKQNQQIMVYYARKSREFNILSITLIVFSIAEFILMPVIKTWYSGVPWNVTNLPFIGFFPFSFKESPIFEIVYIMQSIAGFFAGIIIVSVDCFLYTIVFHACGQFDILAITLERYNSYARHNYMKATRSRVCACLSCIVKRHVLILNYMDVVRTSFSDFLLIQLFVYCFNLVLCGRQLIMYIQDNNFNNCIFFITYVLIISYIIFVYCYISECIMEKSENIGRIVQNLQYRFPRDSNLAIIKARSRIKSCRLTAGKFFTMSFSYYTAIVINTMSYILSYDI